MQVLREGPVRGGQYFLEDCGVSPSPGTSRWESRPCPHPKMGAQPAHGLEGGAASPGPLEARPCPGGNARAPRCDSQGQALCSAIKASGKLSAGQLLSKDAGWEPPLEPVPRVTWRRAWQPTPVLLPGEFHGQRSLASYYPWGCRESDTLTPLHAPGALVSGLWTLGTQSLVIRSQSPSHHPSATWFPHQEHRHHG